MLQFVEAVQYVSRSALQLGMAVAVCTYVCAVVKCVHTDTQELQYAGVGLCKCSVLFASTCVDFTALRKAMQFVRSLKVDLFRR